MGHASSREFSHSKIACENLFDRLQAYCKPLREGTCRKKLFFFEKLRYGLTNVTQRLPGSRFVIKPTVSLFEVPASTPDHDETFSCFFKDFGKFSMYRFRFFPLQ
jgi:hypothetical protein